jgi:hypothetical protein
LYRLSFISNYTSAISDKEQRKATIELAEKLTTVKAKIDPSNVGARCPMTDKMKECTNR